MKPRSERFGLHSAVWPEIEAAADWYLERSPDAEDAFLAEIENAFAVICDAPLRSPKYLYGTRRFLLHKFPFSVIYLSESGIITIVAVAHNKRKPGYWKKRI